MFIKKIHLRFIPGLPSSSTNLFNLLWFLSKWMFSKRSFMGLFPTSEENIETCFVY